MLFLLALFVGANAQNGLLAPPQTHALGDRLTRAFGVFDAMPITTPTEGWKRENEECIPNVGIVYYEGDGRSASNPFGLGYTPFGQVSMRQNELCKKISRFLTLSSHS